MAKCANCAADALYIYEVADSFVVNYCQRHLPGFLTKLQKSGQLKTTTAFETEKAAALEAVATKPSKKKTVEEPVTEESPEEPAADAAD